MNNSFNKQWPFSLILLPAFFVFNGWNNFYYLIKFKDILWIFLLIMFSSIILFSFFLLILKNKLKAGILYFLTGTYILFYGYIYDQLQHHARFLSHHSILIILLGVLFGIAIFKLNRSSISGLIKFNRFLNIMLLVLCSYELIHAVIISKKTHDNIKSKYTSDNKIKYTYPNIYILVFDEYASSKSLKRDYGYDNSKLDSFLIGNSFYLMKESKSNYLRTNLSIASLLNFDYTNGLIPRDNMNANDLFKSHRQIKYNAFFRLAKKLDYEIYNYSIFDTEISPSKVKNEYILNNERIIISNTMISRLISDLEPSLQIPYLKKILRTTVTAETYRHYNENVLSTFLKDIKANKSEIPKLTYAHFLMPHPPFLYDSLSKPIYFDEQKMENYYEKKFVPNYLHYLTYTNSYLRKIVSTILTENNNNCIIFLLGDHGYKIMDDSTLPTDHFFNNLQSIYLPKKNYYPLKQTSTPVNVMRHIINTAFNYHLPFLIDSSVLLGNKW